MLAEQRNAAVQVAGRNQPVDISSFHSVDAAMRAWSKKKTPERSLSGAGFDGLI